MIGDNEWGEYLNGLRRHSQQRHRPLFEPAFARKGGLCFCHAAPEYSKRAYILSGYRPLCEDPNILASIFNSLSYFHNESGNIYTHLIRFASTCIQALLVKVFIKSVQLFKPLFRMSYIGHKCHTFAEDIIYHDHLPFLFFEDKLCILGALWHKGLFHTILYTECEVTVSTLWAGHGFLDAA